MRLCPVCGSESRVYDGRSTGPAFRRRRRCLSCDERWTTYEIPASTVSAMVEFAAAAASLADVSSKASGLSAVLCQAIEDYDVMLYQTPEAVSVTKRKRVKRDG